MYIIIYNGESDFIKVETDHPETVITDLIKEGYPQDEIELYKVAEVSIGVEIKEVEVKIDA